MMISLKISSLSRRKGREKARPQRWRSQSRKERVQSRCVEFIMHWFTSRLLPLIYLVLLCRLRLDFSFRCDNSRDIRRSRFPDVEEVPRSGRSTGSRTYKSSNCLRKTTCVPLSILSRDNICPTSSNNMLSKDRTHQPCTSSGKSLHHIVNHRLENELGLHVEDTRIASAGTPDKKDGLSEIKYSSRRKQAPLKQQLFRSCPDFIEFFG